MDAIHGVDTSWLHHSKGRSRTTSSAQLETVNIDDANTKLDGGKTKTSEPEKPVAANGVNENAHAIEPKAEESRDAESNASNSAGVHHHHHFGLHHAGHKGNVEKETVPASVTPVVATSNPHTDAKTPNTPPAASKSGKDNGRTASPSLGRKSSWISSLSSKFSSKDKEQKDQPPQTQNGNGINKLLPSPKIEKTDPITPVGKASRPDTLSPPSPANKSSSFLSSALRRLSSSTGTSTTTKTVPNGGVCPRRVMNVDPYRERCQITDLQPEKLRRVAFCVDVEIAATPKYRDDSPEDPTVTTVQQRKRSGSQTEKEKKNKAKTKDRAEGAALKHPNVMADKKEKAATPKHVDKTNNDDMFEIPDDDDAAPKATVPFKATKGPLPPKRSSSPKQPSPTRTETQKKNPMSPLHHDFGPSGMFEVDDFDLPEEEKQKPTPRHDSTGGSPHHDFGRHGMFEIPSASEDESSEPSQQKPARRFSGNKSASPNRSGSASQVGPQMGSVPPGHVYTEHLMFEIPDHDLDLGLSNPAVPEEMLPAATKVEKTPEPIKEQPPSAQATNGHVAEGKQDETAVGDPSVEETENGAPATTRKKEKKRKSEEERKERKERKKQAAIANGSLPVELTGDDAPGNQSAQQASNKPKSVQNRPTTDPLRIYRRCCSLRETVPLPRVVEQLSSPTVCDPLNPATVLSLDLSGETIQMSDLVTLGDWLGVVPVQRLILEGCGLNDESVRIVLAGLLAVKTSDQARHNKHIAKKNGEKAKAKSKDKKERTGVISKLSLKNNQLIGRRGWMHIGCFMNMAKSLRAIDLSMIPFPKKPLHRPISPVATTLEAPQRPPSRRESVNSAEDAAQDPFDVFARCIAERNGGEQLDEIVMGDCGLSSDRIERLIDAAIACKCTRFGLAHNNLDAQGLLAVARYIRSGSCLGLDLGGNDLSDPDHLKIVIDALDYAENKMYAISLADTNIGPEHLKTIFPAWARLPDFRFFDLSHNHKLFDEQPSATGQLRKWLPRMKALKKINLNDVNMRSEDAIALAEIAPEMPSVAHISILQNPVLTALANASDEASQEEACALYASLMAATRVSKTIVHIDIDVPGPENSEVVKALAKQVVAYSLRNVEHGEAYKAAAALIAEPHGGEDAVAVPDILLHLVGHVDNFDENHDDDPPAPDQDYLVGGTGVVKALSVVLGNKSRDLRRLSRDITPMQSGTNSPKPGESAFSKGKAMHMSKNLLESAKKIKFRLQPALVRARAESEDSDNFRRLFHLDATLERVIQRFEEEYPECRSVRPKSMVGLPLSGDAIDAAGNPISGLAGEEAVSPLDGNAIAEEDEEDGVQGSLALSLRRSRHGSDVSLASRNLNNEEGRLHRFGQRVRREILPPVHTVDHHWGTSGDGNEPLHLTDLRRRLEEMDADEIRQSVENKGVDAVLKEMNATKDCLAEIERQGGGVWEKCMKAGMLSAEYASKAEKQRQQQHSQQPNGKPAAETPKKSDQAIADDSDSGLEFSV